jgi:hypothetical protein
MGVMKAEMEQFATAILSAMDSFERRITNAFNERMDALDIRVTHVEQSIVRIDKTLVEMQESLDAALLATDKHTVQLFDHTKRIGRLEKRLA